MGRLGTIAFNVGLQGDGELLLQLVYHAVLHHTWTVCERVCVGGGGGKWRAAEEAVWDSKAMEAKSRSRSCQLTTFQSRNQLAEKGGKTWAWQWAH